MGVYQSASIQLTVPAGRVAPLAAAIRERLKDDGNPWWGGKVASWSDRDVAAWLLYAAEGGEATPDNDWFRDDVYTVGEDGSLEISAWSDGKLSFDSDTVEGLYADHMASGVVDALCEGENFRVRIEGGRVSRHAGVIVYPTDDVDHERAGLREAVARAEQAEDEGSNDREIEALRDALERALALIPGWTNDTES